MAETTIAINHNPQTPKASLWLPHPTWFITSTSLFCTTRQHFAQVLSAHRMASSDWASPIVTKIFDDSSGLHKPPSNHSPLSRHESLTRENMACSLLATKLKAPSGASPSNKIKCKVNCRSPDRHTAIIRNRGDPIGGTQTFPRSIHI